MATRYALKADRATALATIKRVAAAHEVHLTLRENSLLVYQGDQDLGVIELADRGDGSELLVDIARGTPVPILLAAFSATVIFGLVYYLPSGVAAAQITVPLLLALAVNVGLWRLVLKVHAMRRAVATALGEALAPLQLSAPTTVRALPAGENKKV